MRERAGQSDVSYPLSAAQQAFWFVDRVPGRRTQQIEGCLLRVLGEVDAGRLGSALAGIARRHPALRSGVGLVDGMPRQSIIDAVTIPLAEMDFSRLSEHAAETTSIRWARQFCAEPFTLDTPPLWRAALVRLPDQRNLIILAAHHMICDGWTLRLLLEEIDNGYHAAPTYPPHSPYPPYPRCLLDRDREWRGSDSVVAYWRRVLDDCVAPRVRPAVANAAVHGDSAAACAMIPRSVTELVRKLARRQRVTPFVVATAVYAVTIARFSGATRIPVASAHHGRPDPSMWRVAGLFSTMFVMLADLTDDPTFENLLARLRPIYRTCLANRAVTMEDLALDRKLSREPYFRHVISYHPISFTTTRFAGRPATLELLSAKPSSNELELHVRERADSFDVQLRVDPTVLDSACARQVLDAFCRQLADLAADPTLRVDAAGPFPTAS